MNFMQSKFFRNFTAFFLEIFSIFTSAFGILMAMAYYNERGSSYFILVAGIFVIACLFKLAAKRLWVTKVCPNCCENRAIVSKTYYTGNSIVVDITKESDGYYKTFEDEYETVDKCKYGCGFEYSETFTKERTEKV